jgi:hypothetical protein
MKFHPWMLLPVGFVCIIGLVVYAFVQSMPKEVSHKFTWGECVEMRLTGEQGMVVRIYQYSVVYQVRVAKASNTNSAMFGPDNTENQRYALVGFREFELRECQ